MYLTSAKYVTYAFLTERKHTVVSPQCDIEIGTVCRCRSAERLEYSHACVHGLSTKWPTYLQDQSHHFLLLMLIETAIEIAFLLHYPWRLGCVLIDLLTERDHTLPVSLQGPQILTSRRMAAEEKEKEMVVATMMTENETETAIESSTEEIVRDVTFLLHAEDETHQTEAGIVVYRIEVQ